MFIHHISYTNGMYLYKLFIMQKKINKMQFPCTYLNDFFAVTQQQSTVWKY